MVGRLLTKTDLHALRWMAFDCFIGRRVGVASALPSPAHSGFDPWRRHPLPPVFTPLAGLERSGSRGSIESFSATTASSFRSAGAARMV